MPIKKTSGNVFHEYLEEKAKRLRSVLINNLIYVGDQAVNEARNNHRYANQTGNLQSSIGYCLLEDGNVIKESSFDVVKDGQQGARQGRGYLHSLISEHPTGLVLIVVAGMEYAAYVEAKNLNVIDSAEQLAEHELPRLMKALKL